MVARSSRWRNAATSVCSAWRMIWPWVPTMVRMVVSDSSCSAWVWETEQARYCSNRQLLGSKQAQEMQAASDTKAVVRR